MHKIQLCLLLLLTSSFTDASDFRGRHQNKSTSTKETKDVKKEATSNTRQPWPQNIPSMRSTIDIPQYSSKQMVLAAVYGAACAVFICHSYVIGNCESICKDV